MNNALTLLYVEDDDLVRENYTEIFKTYFKTVLTTDDGNKALEIYEKNSIDVETFDSAINGINGLNVAAKIREKDEDTIILIVSAYSDKDKLLKAVNLHLFGYLVKPITHKDLDDTLQKIISQKLQITLFKLQNNFTWENNSHTLSYNGENTKLTKNEAKVVQILINSKNRYLSACEIQEELFENDTTDTNCNNVVQLISRMKKKFFKLYNLDDFFIENCYGNGYKIVTH